MTHALHVGAVILVILIVLIPCCIDSSPTGLPGVTWDLLAYRNTTGEMMPVLEGTEISAKFGSDESLSGSAGCNQYFASYSVDGSRISIEQLAWTEMYCMGPEGINAQETIFLTQLEKAASYEIGADKLVILDPSGQTLLVFTLRESS
jgi:heat shock protein HslJ